jgi:hypothetical protein
MPSASTLSEATAVNPNHHLKAGRPAGRRPDLHIEIQAVLNAKDAS